MIVYDPFWKTLKKSSKNHVYAHKRSSYIQLHHRQAAQNKPITTTTLNDLCRILGCKVDEILEYVPSPDDQCL